MLKRVMLAALAAAVLVPLAGCGFRRCSNRCSNSSPPPAYYCPPNF